MNALIIFLFSLVGWLMALGVFFVLRDIPRGFFITVHYVVDIVLFGVLFGVYYRFFKGLSPFVVMAVAMLSFIVFEFILWKFIAPGSASQYLNFVDWIVPAFLIASTIYLTGILLK